MIIKLAIIAFFIFIGVCFKVFLTQFYLYLCKEADGYRTKIFNTTDEFNNVGEYLANVAVVGTIAVVSFILYKCFSAFVAYLLSDDLISFFTLLRGVFTIRSGSEFQSPFLPVHFWSGYLITPALQLIAVHIMYDSIRHFMTNFNQKFEEVVDSIEEDIYDEKDLLFFNCIAVVIFIWLEMSFYSQYMSFITGFAHFILLSFSVLGLICYYLTIAHIQLLKNKSYIESLSVYFEFSNQEKTIIYSPKNMYVTTYFLGVLLHIPFNTGPQFLYSNILIVLSLSVSALSFYWIFKKRNIAKAYNCLGTAMMYKSLNEKISYPSNMFSWIVNTYKKSLLGGVILLMLFFIIMKWELTLFVFLLVLTVTLLVLSIIILFYVIGQSIAYLTMTYSNQSLPVLSLTKYFNFPYLRSIYDSIVKSTTPQICFVFLLFAFFSFFPKNYDVDRQQNESFVNAVFGGNGSPLFIEYSHKNTAIRLDYEEIPEFVFKILYLQEDRRFVHQDSWWVNLSNWHGVSITPFLRYFRSGGGGSNLNMQLIKNEAFPFSSFPQDIQRKYAEMVSSYHLSLQMTPKEIVTQYLNKASMHGGIGHKGLMAASLRAFNLSVWDINPLEIFYLVSSLTSGNRFKTAEGKYISYVNVENHKEEIKATLLKKAERWLNSGHLSRQEFSILRNSELRFTNHSPKTETNPSTRDFLIKEMNRQNSSAFTYRSTLSLENQEKIRNSVHVFESGYINNTKIDDYQLYSAALVVDVKTGEIIGHHGGHGNSDLTRFSTGFPLASLIKPFILLELLEQGFPTDFKLYDGPVTGKFTPKNDEHPYSYTSVKIPEILKISRNAPMVNIREITDPLSLYRKVENRFYAMGISKDSYLGVDSSSKRQEITLNYPIGSRNMTLYDVAQAYQVLLNNGEYVRLSVLNKASNEIHSANRDHKTIYTRNVLDIKSALQSPLMQGGTAHHLKKILPESGIYYAKTGTSDGAKHGYTVLSDGNIMVVTFVTYGKNDNGYLELNKTPPIPHHSGGHSAGVLAALIYNEFH